ncbi:MAG: DUF1127 domain-containing protein [Pseudomonadota bacterium]
MAFYDNARASDRANRAGASIISRVAAAIAQWNEARKTRAALARLSDRELDDIGLSRADIDSI